MAPETERVRDAELRRFLSARTTWICLAVALIVVIGFAAVTAYALGTAEKQGNGASNLFQTDLIISGIPIAQFVLAVLACLFFPRSPVNTGATDRVAGTKAYRCEQFSADAAIVGVASFVIVFVASWIALGLTINSVNSYSRRNAFTLEGIWTVGGAALAAALISVMAMAFKALLNNSRNTIIVVVLVFALAIASSTSSVTAIQDLHAFLPTVAASAFFSLHPGGPPVMLFAQMIAALAWAFVPSLVARRRLSKR